MKQLHGLDALIQLHNGRLTIKALADILMQDLRQCCCFIYGSIDDVPVLLAKLKLQSESLTYEMFDRRIDLIVAGKMSRNDCVPLSYRLQGEIFSITGRCSMIPKVCGVDLYLNSSYSGHVGDRVHQKFHISLKEVFTSLS